MPDLEPPNRDPSWALIGGLVALAFVFTLIALVLALA